MRINVPLLFVWQSNYIIFSTDFFSAEQLLVDANEILSSQVHEHIFGGDDENNNLNGPRRLLAENLDYQQMELTTEDREDHTFNGTKSLLFSFYFTSGHKLDDDDEITNP